MASIIEVTNIRTNYRKTIKLRNVNIIGREASDISIKK